MSEIFFPYLKKNNQHLKLQLTINFYFETKIYRILITFIILAFRLNKNINVKFIARNW